MRAVSKGSIPFLLQCLRTAVQYMKKINLHSGLHTRGIYPIDHKQPVHKLPGAETKSSFESSAVLSNALI